MRPGLVLAPPYLLAVWRLQRAFDESDTVKARADQRVSFALFARFYDAAVAASIGQPEDLSC